MPPHGKSSNPLARMKTQKWIKPAAALAILALVIIGGGYFRQNSAPLTDHNRKLRNTKPSAEMQRAAAENSAFTDFSNWQNMLATTPAAQRPAHLAAGLQLAQARRVVMTALIQSDPQEALKRAVSLDVWQNLPPELCNEIEEPFSVLANFRVLPVCKMGASATPAGNFPEATRWTEIDGQPLLQSFVFGRRAGLMTKEKSPVQGIRLGGLAALREEVFHPLTAAETEVVKTIYPLANPVAGTDFASGESLGAQPITAVAGGERFEFSDAASLEKFSSKIAALDEKPGPLAGAAVLFLPKGTTTAATTGVGFDLNAAALLSNNLATTWTETKRKVFMIRCDFSDKTDATFPVVNAGTYGTLLNTTVSDSIRAFSYGKTWIDATVASDITRLPQTSAYYATQISTGNARNTALLADAKATYLATHPTFVSANYDIIGVWFVREVGMKSGGVDYAGLAGGSDLWIQGSIDPDVLVHEFGHNYGLGHSSFWAPPAGSINPTDTAGTSEEYGDLFDVMGDGPTPIGAFHAEAKQRLNWLATGAWVDATAAVSATHRLYRIDDPLTTGIRGVRVTKGSGEYLWLSYRRLFSNSWLKAGANIVWQRPGQKRSWLIDTTPGSISGISDRSDGSLAIGRTYSDGNNHITALARSGITPNEYLDIRVNTGPFPGNVAPVVNLSGPATIAARQTCIFTANATDADGDALAYSWDFGQGFTFDNNSSAVFAWNSGGTYTVKVTVSDMKGNRTEATKIVTVSDPISSWTERANTSVGDFQALVASPNKVIAVGYSNAVSKGPVAISTDGSTWTATQLGNNQRVYGGVWDGTQFLLAGEDYNFTAPVGWAGCVFTSTTANAGSWTQRIFSGPQLNGIAFGNGIYVAVGDNGTIRRSTDGITWLLVTSGTTNTLSSVSYGGGTFVAVGYVPNNGDSTILTSSDGLTWTNRSAGAGVANWQDLRYIQWAKDRFIASGWYSKLRQSTDLGASFTTTRTVVEDTPALAYGNGVWLAAGVDRDRANADADLVSTDGSNWTSLVTPALDDRNAAIFFKNTFITAGDNHSIRQSGAILPSANGYFAWRENYFPDHGPLSLPENDSDADGVVNLLEYAFARSPLTGAASDGPAALPQAVVVASDPLLNDRIALQISMPEPAAADLSYVVEASSTLSGDWTALATKVGTGGWTWNPASPSRIVQATAASGRMLVKIGDSVSLSSNPARFLRLRTFVNP
jgi:PKD domain